MENNIATYKTLKCVKILVPIVGIGIILTTVTFALIITTLVKVNKGFDDIQSNSIETTSSTSTRTTVATNPPGTITSSLATTMTATNQPIFNAILPTHIHIQDVMSHLNELQRIATEENENRAIHTSGFNRTLDYIRSSLMANTNYSIKTEFFPVRQFNLVGNPVLISSIDGLIRNYTYSTNLSIADFSVARFSTSASFSDYIELTVIPNMGCSDEDWENTTNGKVALVKRGTCSFVDKAARAAKFNATALLIYNDGNSSNHTEPIEINLGQTNQLPALFLSFPVGQELVDAAQNLTSNVRIYIDINVASDLPLPVGNVCADTPTGDPTQTIVIGSHSDSVPAGPGINDNGSGSAANLGLAIALARLFQTSTYDKYKYRIRFCWWSAEEVVLLGSVDHVKQAKIATTVGERLSDYLINLNYDMLGSPNYIFGIYDGRTANNATPVGALPGSNKISALFRDWFEGQKLPWDYTDFSGRSDYGPFLAEGIVAGGLSTGAEQKKSLEERDRYDQMLGQGSGGLSDVAYDSCYHEACDSIQNIDVFAYAKMVQAAAYALEYLARQDDLEKLLYPNRTSSRFDIHRQQHTYDSINEYFGLLYF